jgi:TRAP-type C4-dicarboxylate transport system permease small subunit
VVVGLLGAVALLLSAFEIVTRYFLPAYAPDWGEEIIVYVTIWGIFIAGSALVEENRHVRADIIVRLFGSEGQRAAEIFNTLAGLAFTALLAWYGWAVVDFALLLDERSISSLKFPIAWYYACLPAGMALMALRYAIRLWELVARFDPAKHTFQEGEFRHD